MYIKSSSQAFESEFAECGIQILVNSFLLKENILAEFQPDLALSPTNFLTNVFLTGFPD